MSELHSRFYGCISQVFFEQELDINLFKRTRSFVDVKLELQNRDDPLDFAAIGLSELCDGSCGPFDKAVVTAVLQFLDETYYGRYYDDSRATFNKFHALKRIFPSDRAGYRAWAEQCYQLTS